MLIDFLIIVIVLLLAALGFRKGFGAMAVSFFAFAISIALTVCMYQSVYSAFMSTDFGNKLEGIISADVEKRISDITDGTLDKLPVIRLISDNPMSEGKNSDGFSEAVTEKTVQAAVSIAILILTYILSKIIVAIIKAIVNKTCQLPVIHAANSVLGLICGLMLGFVWGAVVYLASGCCVLISDIPAVKNQFDTSLIVLLISDLVL